MATQASIDKINMMYVAYYGRPGDPGGVEFWADVVDVNGGVMSQEILNAFGTSAEFTDRFGGMTNEELVNQLYNFMFGRDAEAEGLAFWVGELDSGNRTLVDIALAIAEGAQNEDATILANKVNVAGYYTAQTEATFADYDAEHIDAAKAILDSVNASPISVVVAKLVVDETLASQGGVAQEFNLTTGVDTVNVTEDFAKVKGVVLPGGASTFSFGDDIQGNETTTLKLTVGGTGTADLAEVADVGKIDIVNGVGGGTVTFNGTLWDNIGMVRLEGGADGLTVALNSLQLGTALAIDGDVSGSLDVDFTSDLSADLWAHRNSSIVWDHDIVASVAMGEDAGAYIFAPSEDISIGNVTASVAASGEFELTVSATGAGDDVSVGDIDIAISGDGSASADIEIYGGDSATAGNINVVGTGEDVEFSFSISADSVTVGDVTAILSGESSDFWFYAYGTNGAGDVTIGNISVTNDSMLTDDSDTSVSISNSSGDISIGNVAFLGGNELSLSVENWGDGGDNLSIGNITMELDASGSLDIDISNTNDTVGADGGNLSIGDISLTIAEDGTGDVDIENELNATGATTDLLSGTLTIGDIEVILGADATLDIYVENDVNGSSTDTAAVGATTLGDLDVTMGIGADFEFDLLVNNTASGDVGAVKVGNVNVQGDDGSSLEYSVSVSATNAGDIVSVEVGDIDVALGVSGSIDELYTYIWAAAGDILSVDLGSMAIDLGVDGYGESISTDIYASSGDIVDVAIGDVDITLGESASITQVSYSIWAGSGDVNNVSIGDLTVNMAMGSSLGDFNIYIWATSGTIDTVSVGDLDVTVGAGADFDDYEFQAWATNMVNTVTLGDITAVVEAGGSFSYSASVSASGDVGSFTIGDIDLTSNGAASLSLDIHAWAWNGDIGSLNVGDISIAATDSVVFIDISNTASGDAGVITVGDIDVNVTASATVTIDIDSFGGTNDADVTIGNLDIAGAGSFTLAVGQDVATASLDYTGDVTIGDITVSTGGGNDLGIGGATDILAGVVTVGGTITLGDIDYSAYGAAASIDVSGYEGAGSIIGSDFADTITDNDGTNVLTGGDGADIFSFVATNANITEATADEITDFVSGLDTVQFDVSAGTFDASTYYEGTYASFAAFMAGAATQMTSSPEDNLIAGQVGSDVWLAIDLDGGDAVDTVIKLSGVNISTLNFADFDFV